MQLERGLKIVDSPGVVFDDADDTVDAAGRPRPTGSGVLLRNVVKVEDLEDPIALGISVLLYSELIQILILPML